MTLRTNLLKIQKRIHRSLEIEVRRLLGELPESIKRYEREFQKDFRGLKGSLRGSDKEELIRSIRESDVSFIADYHTFPQAQRTALRILREVVHEGESSQWVVGLELVPSKHQDALDRFQRGEITEAEFHSLIRYKEEWGFPWSNYAPLFEWAKEKKIRLIALNRPKEFVNLREERDLEERDVWAAGVLTDLLMDARAGKEKLRAIVVFGELHVSHTHLPKQLKILAKNNQLKPLPKVTIVHQNHEGLYWEMAKREREHETSVVEMRKGTYCVLSATPWTKLQSLVAWAEGIEGSAPDYSISDSIDYTESDEETELFDPISELQKTTQILSEFLKMESPPFESLSLRTIKEADFFLSDPDLSTFKRTERKLLAELVEKNFRFYFHKLPSGQSLAYLGTPSPNGFAEIAAAHLQARLTRSSSLFPKEADELWRMTVESAFRYLCSLLINPKRKCDLPKDHRKRLKERAKSPWETDLKHASALILKWISQEKNWLAHPEKMTQVTGISDLRVAVLAARFYGQLLGHRIHHCLMDGEISVEKIQELFLRPIPKPERAVLKLIAQLSKLNENLSSLPSKGESL